eukprot:gnl/Chilomastix_caulleri/6881.p1 GENE.gnl/Chilomastix_caulleri/6881~~gnl/Chilomastix_caulleri/6881.p1  ORF type:complete len:108 (-),score=40.61 gnl/Chilomastix_caulleri/6881:16-339(-)
MHLGQTELPSITTITIITTTIEGQWGLRAQEPFTTNTTTTTTTNKSDTHESRTGHREMVEDRDLDVSSNNHETGEMVLDDRCPNKQEDRDAQSSGSEASSVNEMAVG